MNIMVLIGQRKCAYAGEYAPEALECISEIHNSDNPDFLIEKKAYYEDSDEFDALTVVELSVPDEAIDNALFPNKAIIPATVV